MALSYSADEIYEIGVTIEKNGKKFYEASAGMAKEKTVKDLFTSLAKWENQHVKLFEGLKAGLPQAAREPVSYDPANELQLYLKAAADSHIFRADADIPGLVSRCKTAIDALSMALVFEKDSVVLYSTMLNLVPENLGKKDVEKILNEELKHVSIIMGEMEKLKK
ncbi:MAG TPA: ferritin family protein [Chitinivibrionales bacterium]|nr:ferritin family protein [Chitinivibrionales bacterium]